MFEALVAPVPVPTLKPGAIVVMNNLFSHKTVAVRARIESAGAALWFLPPNSPDVKPIELAFSKIKQALRRLRRRVHRQLCETMQHVLDQVTTSDTAGYFHHCGYPLQTK